MAKTVLFVVGRKDVSAIARELGVDYVLRVNEGDLLVSVDERLRALNAATADEVDVLRAIKNAVLDCGTVNGEPARKIYRFGDKVIGEVLPTEMRSQSQLIAGIWEWSERRSIRVISDDGLPNAA